MQVFDKVNYGTKLVKHYENYFGISGKRFKFDNDQSKIFSDNFCILEMPPNDRHQMYCYCTVGMSNEKLNNELIELVMYSPKADSSVARVLSFCAAYHMSGLPLDLHHTVNIGQPWLDNSKCDHGYISLPYLDGPELEIFNFANHDIHCYWFIPITEKERDYKIANGFAVLEQLFEETQIDYLNPARNSLVA